MESKTDSNRQKLDLEEARDTMVFLNGELFSLLAEYDKSAGEIKLPQPVKFESGEIDSWPKRLVASAIRKGIESGQIFFGVTKTFSGPRFEVLRMKRTDIKEAGGAIIMALFTGNFEARCNADGLEPKDSLERCLEQVIYEDIKIDAEKLARETFKPSEKVGLVGLVNFKIVGN